MPTRSTSRELWRIPIWYALLGMAWIYGSDAALHSLFPHLDADQTRWVQTGKGIGYVLATTLLLAFLLRRYARRVHLADQYYKMLFSANPVPMVLVDLADNRILTANEAANQAYGLAGKASLSLADLSIRSLESRSLLDLAPPAEGLRDCGVWQHSDGRESFARLFTSRYQVDGQESMLCQLLDVTEQVLAEQAARQHLRRIEEMREKVSDLYLSLTPDWRIRAVNAAFEHATGKDRRELLGQDVWETFIGARELAFYPQCAKAMEEREAVHFEEYYPPLGIWLRVSAYPSPEGISVYAQDVTVQKGQMERITESERNLTSVINNTEDSIWYIDRTHQIKFSNRAYDLRREQILGAETPQERRVTTPSGFETAPRLTLSQGYTRAFAGERCQFELFVTLKNSFQAYYDVLLNPVFERGGQVIGIGCFSRDITARKAAESRMLAQNDRLKQIAWSQSHLVRGPLASILGLVGLFDTDPDPAANRELIRHLQKTALQLDSAVRSIVHQANEG